jgi:hypothetical protein
MPCLIQDVLRAWNRHNNLLPTGRGNPDGPNVCHAPDQRVPVTQDLLKLDAAELRGCCMSTISAHRGAFSTPESADCATNPCVAVKEKFADPQWHSVSLVSPVSQITWR